MAENRPQIWVYEAHHLYSGLDFADACVRISAPNVQKLMAKAEKQLGGEFSTPFLMTKGGLEHPMSILVGNRSRTFTPDIKFHLLPRDEKLDMTSWYIREHQRGKQMTEQLKGRDYEIWALKRYPDLEHGIYSWFEDDSSPLFDPEADPTTLQDPVKETYEDLVQYDGSLKGQKPVVLGWYTRGGDRFRIATRPYRTDEKIIQHRLVIATTLPLEASQPAAV